MSGQFGLPVDVNVLAVAWWQSLCAGFDLIAVKSIVDVVTVDFGHLQLLGEGLRRGGLVVFIPVSVAAFSPPAISSKLEMEGRDGFLSSAGGDGGD